MIQAGAKFPAQCSLESILFSRDLFKALAGEQVEALWHTFFTQSIFDLVKRLKLPSRSFFGLVILSKTSITHLQ